MVDLIYVFVLGVVIGIWASYIWSIFSKGKHASHLRLMGRNRFCVRFLFSSRMGNLGFSRKQKIERNLMKFLGKLILGAVVVGVTIAVTDAIILAIALNI